MRLFPLTPDRPLENELKKDRRKIPRFALPKVSHSERSEESALGRLGPELQILRFAQDDSHFEPHPWAGSPLIRVYALPFTLHR